MKYLLKGIQFEIDYKKSNIMKAKTGERCPVTGIWEVQDCPSITFVFNEGSIIPDYKGNHVYWELKEEVSVN